MTKYNPVYLNLYSFQEISTDRSSTKDFKDINQPTMGLQKMGYNASFKVLNIFHSLCLQLNRQRYFGGQ